MSDHLRIDLRNGTLSAKKLCEINPVYALSSWEGPLKEKYDFIFSDWVFEVKGTRTEVNNSTAIVYQGLRVQKQFGKNRD